MNHRDDYYATSGGTGPPDPPDPRDLTARTGLLPLAMLPLEIPALAGPVCDMTAELGGCYHDSCGDLEMDGRIRLIEGPLCATAEFQGECPHQSCAMREPAQGECVKHGWQLVTDHGVSTGFAGGRVYWANLACGCSDIDESDDVRAAY